jgi:hypothetical protein
MARNIKDPSRWVERICENCGATFEARVSEMRKGPRRYCSRDCWRAHAPSPATRPEVRDKISAAKTTHGRSLGRRQRQLEHAGFTLAAKGERVCRNCGGGHNLHMHHAIPRSMWREGIMNPLNGVPLCIACHLGWHRRDVVLYRDIFRPEEWACLCSAQLLGQNVMAWLDDRYPSRPRVGSGDG